MMTTVRVPKDVVQDVSKQTPALSDTCHLKARTEGTREKGGSYSAGGSWKRPLEEVTAVMGVDFAVYRLFLCQTIPFVEEQLRNIYKQNKAGRLVHGPG